MNMNLEVHVPVIELFAFSGQQKEIIFNFIRLKQIRNLAKEALKTAIHQCENSKI